MADTTAALAPAGDPTVGAVPVPVPRGLRLSDNHHLSSNTTSTKTVMDTDMTITGMATTKAMVVGDHSMT